jgi:putative spermidine/putrescine transport system permease protein
MLPGVVLGLALYTFYISLDLPFSRRLSGLLIGHVILTMPFVIGTVSAALYNFDVTLEEAARSLGAGPLKAFRTVTLPIIVSGVLAGFIFAFIISFGAFDMSLFLATPDLTPLPIAMYQSLRFQFEPTAAAAGTFAIGLVVVSMLLIAMLTDIRRLAGIKFR